MDLNTIKDSKGHTGR